MSSIDVVGFLPAPPGKAHAGAADILESAFAYAVAGSICVYEVHKLNFVCTLQGGHMAPVTAIKWCPAYHSRSFEDPSHLRLASGDSDGGVVVWDVLSASQLLRLQDVPGARDLLRDYTAAARSDRDSSGSASTSSVPAGGSGPSSSGITSLAWVMPDSNVLAVVVAPALLLLWDVAGGSLLWKRELGTGMQLFGQLAVAPLDSRQLCLCGSSGALVVLQLTDPGRDKVATQQYRVNTQAREGTGSKPIAGSTTLHALFPVAPGLLLLVLPRELLLFDLDLGAPAASTPLPSTMPAFSHLLGVFGGGVCQGGGDEGGLDFAYCSHVDGMLSVWVRVPGALRFKLGSSSRLTPAPLRGANSQVSLVMIKACLWRGHAAHEHKATSAQTAGSTGMITAQLNRSLAAMHLTTRDAQASSSVGPRGRADAGAGSVSSSGSSSNSSATVLSGHSLLVMGVTSDGRLWQWQVVLPSYPMRSFVTNSDEPIAAINSSIQAARAAAAPATVMPQLVGLLHGLPGSITATSLQPRPLLLPSHLAALSSSIASSSRRASQHPASSLRVSLVDPFAELAAEAAQQQPTSAAGEERPFSEAAAAVEEAAAGSASQAAAECVVLGAAATATGHLEVFSIRRGHVNALALEVAASHAVHKDAVRGVRWLGSSPLLVSFSSEKSSSGGWRNSLLLTDVRTGGSVPFRDGGGSESSPMLGMRVSPSGSYLLLLLKGAPAELWTTLPQLSASAPPSQSSSRTPSRLGMSAMQEASGAGAGAGSIAGAAAAGAAGAASAVSAGPGCLMKPWRVRLVDLPFSAVEWVAAEEELQKDLFNVWATSTDLEAAAAASAAAGAVSPPPGDATVFERSLSRQISWGVDRTLSALSGPSLSAAASSEGFPSELLAFALADGRSGVLSVRGRKVADVRPKRPSSSPGPGDSVGSALGAVWPLLVQGDADGQLLSWDLTTGHCSSLATGCGLVRRILLAPASPPVLSGAMDAVLACAPSTAASGVESMRAAVLFASGAFGVFDLDRAGRLRPSAASPAACTRFCRALDISWVSLPGVAGAGSVLAVVLQDGSLSLLDVAQCQAQRPGNCRARQALLQQVLCAPSPAQLNGLPGGAMHSMPVVLLAPRPLGSSMLLQQPWVLLLRALLQLGISHNALLYISSTSTEEDDDVRHELQQLLPRSARAVLAHMAAAGTSSLQGHLDSSRLQANCGSDAAAGSSNRPQSPLAKAKSSPLLKNLPGSSNLLAALQASSSARVLVGALQGGGPASSLGGASTSGDASGRSGGEAALLQQQQQQHAALGFGVERFDGDIVRLLRRIAKLRGSGRLLHAHEWKAYTEALTSGLVARRMAVAACISGHHEEARFWSALPATLQRSVKPMHTAIQAAQQQQQQAASTGTPSAAAAAAAAGASAGDLAPVTAAGCAAEAAGLAPLDSQALPGTAAAAARASAGDLAPPTAAGCAADAAGLTPSDSQTLLGTDADADLDSLDDYDRLVQQALESSNSGARAALDQGSLARAAAGGSAAAAAVVQQHGGSSHSPSSSPKQHQALSCRSSGAHAVPGHVRVASGSSGRGTEPPQFSVRSGIRLAAAGRPVLLWDEELVLSEAQERLLWHEALPGQLFEAEGLLERRLLEYVVLGDFSTAVAFLLSTTPESSVRYYRSVVCALALAATASLRAQSLPGDARSTQAAATLHLQAAKVVSAHSASIGDTLLGVPLNCSAGLNADAVQLLQEAGMWQLSASLIARTLTGTERAQALCRWASHVLQHEGSVWRCVGILTSAGCLAAAAQALRAAGLPDCAEAYVLACKQAGLLVQRAAAQQQQQQQAEPGAAGAAIGTHISLAEDYGDEDDADTSLPQQAADALELFDLLGQRSRLMPWVRSSGAAADREGLSGADELRLITSEYHSYLCILLSSL